MVDEQFQEILPFFSTGVSPVEYTTAQKKQLVFCTADFQLIGG